MLIEEEMIVSSKLEDTLSENGIDKSLYSTYVLKENKVCLFEKYFLDEGLKWCSAFYFEGKKHNLKKYENFEEACIDFINILSKVSGKNKEQEKNILSDFKEKLFEIGYSKKDYIRPSISSISRNSIFDQVIDGIDKFFVK